MIDEITIKTEQIIDSYYRITGNNKGSLCINDYFKFREVAAKEASKTSISSDIDMVEKNDNCMPVDQKQTEIITEELHEDNKDTIKSDFEKVNDLEEPFIVRPQPVKPRVVAIPQQEHKPTVSRAVDILNAIAD